jgi:hypothetical protein
MTKIPHYSRRAMVASLVAVSAVPTGAITSDSTSSDDDLVDLGRQFDEVVSEIDQSIDGGSDLVVEVLARLDRIEAAVLATEAATIDGLRVKARAACWARLGDIDASDQPSMDLRMAMSIVRDLIRVHDPELERTDALVQLLAEFS